MMMRRMYTYLRRVQKDESGNASVEFFIIFPVFVMMLLASIELGFITLRHTMLERGMDLAVREIRLGTGTAPQHGQIKQLVCDGAAFIRNCDTQLQLEMTSADIRSFAALGETPDCTDAAEPSKPVREFTPGQQNELMLLRACYKYDPIFPDDMLGSALVKDASGQAAIVSMTAFVQEPL